MPTGEIQATKSDAEFLRGLAGRQLFPFVVLLGVLYLIFQKSAELEFGSIFLSVRQIELWQWSAAIGLTAVSFWSVGRMELVIHRLFKTGLHGRAASISGIAAVSTAQLTGFGLLVGTLARWRLLPDTNLWTAAKITVAISITFLASLGVLACAMTLIATPDIPIAANIATTGLAIAAFLVAISVWRPKRLIALPLPPLKAQARLLLYAAIDTAAAATAMYLLIPGSIQPDPALFYTVFLLALGAGLLGATPGGVGPFEITFLAILPTVPEAPILAAIMGFRIVYYAVPACGAAVAMFFAPKIHRLFPIGDTNTSAPENINRPLAQLALTYVAERAETGLLKQGDFKLLRDEFQRPLSLVAPCNQSLIMLGDPLHRTSSSDQLAKLLLQQSDNQFLVPCVYKCGARTALALRNSGWKTLQVAQEAVISPSTFDLSSPRFRQLRRSLRKAENTGVQISKVIDQIPLAQMRQIAELWEKSRGVARGFSMGRFEETYVSTQTIFIALQNGDLIGFITLHHAHSEMCLDLMCHHPDAPSGTMHLLITSAIQDAAKHNKHLFSLASVPSWPKNTPLPKQMISNVERKLGTPGLRRFKSAFAPRWEPQYLAAPSFAGMSLAAADLADRITRPRPLSK